MSIVFLIILMVPSISIAQWSFDNSGSRVFDMSKNMTKKTTIELKYVESKDIQKTCDTMSRNYGNKGYSYGVLACTFFWDSKCVIVVPKEVDMRMIGHEVMHCFQGDWHAGKNH